MADRLNGLLGARQLGNFLPPWDSRMNVSENREAPRRKEDETETGQTEKGRWKGVSGNANWITGRGVELSSGTLSNH
eukprot:scaffold2154_cov169-Alexandrium_tamarense.AAC.2